MPVVATQLIIIDAELHASMQDCGFQSGTY